MLRRHANTAFGDVHVFPGGVVDADDETVADRCVRADAREAARQALNVEDALAAVSAAIRELFEETGVLLARNGSGGPLGATTLAAVAASRRPLCEGALGWRNFLERHDLLLDCERLEYFAYWVTPHGEPRRFATRFFVAALPDGQLAGHDGLEHTDCCWLSAAAVLDAQRAGELRLIYPTYRTLRDIAGFKTVAEVLDWARARQRSGIARVRPAIVEVDGCDKVVLPGDRRYPQEESE